VSRSEILANAIISNFNHLNLRDDVGKFWKNFMVIERDGKLFGFCDVDRGVILFEGLGLTKKSVSLNLVKNKYLIWLNLINTLRQFV